MRTNERGFTLTEVVVMIVIAVVIAAFAFPSFNLKEIDSVYFHEQVRSAVRYAQRTAVAQRRCVFVSVTPTQLELRYGDASCAITATHLRDLSRNQSFVLTAPSGVALSAAPNPFRFNGLGQPGSAATVTVGAKIVAVNAESGYVQ
jgi:MSHA pilin protein MshC